MSILSKKKDKKEPIADSPQSEETPTPRTSNWTFGRAAATWATTGAILAGVAAGPVGIFLHFVDQPTPVVANATNVRGTLSTSDQLAGNVAVGFVSAWLAASKDDSAALGSYISTDNAALPATGYQYRDIALGSVQPATADGLVSAVVSANVAELAKAAEPKGESIPAVWPRRYFLVVLSVEGSTIAPVSFPTPIAAPSTEGKFPSLEYGNTLSTTDPAGKTVSQFLAAYLVGDGDITRVLSPSTEILPISPAPYTTVTVRTLNGNVQASDAPADGDVLQVLAAVDVTSIAGQMSTTSYALTLTARAQRWEVSALDVTPLSSK